jgi:hypothetical protein
VRAIVSTDVQSPADVHATVRPGVGAELGLPYGITLAAGSNWVGGDIDATTGKSDFNLGISPYAQVRVHLFGDANGRGVQLGTSATYKVVGFEGDPGEGELAVSLQYRMPRYEVGVQGVFGKDFKGDDADAEAHAYAVYRVIPELALGAAGQGRFALATDGAERAYDAIGGAIASLTLGKYQLGALGGASTIGVDHGHAGALAQLFATARF